MPSFTLLILMGILCVSACSHRERTKPVSMGRGIPYYQNEDFSSSWKLLGLDFARAHQKKTMNLTRRSKRYLEGLIRKIKLNNELLFKDLNAEEVAIVDDGRPYHFSTPGGRIFISLGLLRKYIKYEGLLASILTIEMIRGHKEIFVKNIFIPSGVIAFEDLRPLLKINVGVREEINKWTVYALKRSGFNPLYLLRLLQLKNKNFLDFFEGQEEVKDIAVEKNQLKNFLVKRRLFGNVDKVLRNSSREFYHFINEVRGV